MIAGAGWIGCVSKLMVGHSDWDSSHMWDSCLCVGPRAGDSDALVPASNLGICTLIQFYHIELKTATSAYYSSKVCVFFILLNLVIKSRETGHTQAESGHCAHGMLAVLASSAALC